MTKLFLISFIVNLLFVGTGYGYYKITQNEIEVQMQRTASFKLANDEQIRTIEALQLNAEVTAEQLQLLSKQNAEIEAEKARYLNIFKKHDLTKLATAKPGLITERINKGTSDVFKAIEDDSRDISIIDN